MARREFGENVACRVKRALLVELGGLKLGEDLMVGLDLRAPVNWKSHS